MKQYYFGLLLSLFSLGLFAQKGYYYKDIDALNADEGIGIADIKRIRVKEKHFFSFQIITSAGEKIKNPFNREEISFVKYNQEFFAFFQVYIGPSRYGLNQAAFLENGSPELLARYHMTLKSMGSFLYFRRDLPPGGEEKFASWRKSTYPKKRGYVGLLLYGKGKTSSYAFGAKSDFIKILRDMSEYDRSAEDLLEKCQKFLEEKRAKSKKRKKRKIRIKLEEFEQLLFEFEQAQRI